MTPRYGLKLCTFEVATHLGRHARVGAFKHDRIVDLNFATGWYMAQTGEADPQRLADALVPANMVEFLRAGLRAMHTAEELFLGDGPHPADWWERDSPPRGPNDETLVYRPEQVRLLAPLPNHVCRAYAAPGAELPSGEDEASCSARFAAVGGTYVVPGRQRRDVAGFTLVIACGRHAGMGPYLVTPDGMGDLEQVEVVARVNGEERIRRRAAGLQRILEAYGALGPGEMAAYDPAENEPLLAERGDIIEVEAQPIGALRHRLS